MVKEAARGDGRRASASLAAYQSNAESAFPCVLLCRKRGDSVSDQQKAAWLLQHPAALGRALGFKDFTDELHGQWLHNLIYGQEDYTLQAHRGSCKTTCLTLAIALLMLKERHKNIIFLRRTDSDITEVVKGVKRILVSPLTQAIYRALTDQSLGIVKNKSAEIVMDCFSAPRGAVQLLGIGTAHTDTMAYRTAAQTISEYNARLNAQANQALSSPYDTVLDRLNR